MDKLSVQELQQKLGSYASLVTFESAIDCIIVKPREYIRDKTKWTAINKLLKEEGAKWVPILGGIGHWEVPLLKPLIKLTDLTQLQFVLDFEELVKQGYKKLIVKWEK